MRTYKKNKHKSYCISSLHTNQIVLKGKERKGKERKGKEKKKFSILSPHITVEYFIEKWILQVVNPEVSAPWQCKMNRIGQSRTVYIRRKQK